MTTTINGVRKLTVRDRCDRCNARGQVLVVTPAGELVFCSHHANQHSDTLLANGYRFTSEREDER